MKGSLPTTEGDEKTYRVVYAVHEVHEPTNSVIEAESQPIDQAAKPTKFIGLVNLKSLDAGSLALPEEVMLPSATAATTLTVELSYSLLPAAWGKGYATESVNAVLEACKDTRSFWAPFSSLYVRAMVNDGNPVSRRVMDKTGMAKSGIYVWTGKIFLAGEWRERDELHIYGKYLFP
jgi:RimJ/RimL family protein N-acetyltransferase